MTSAADSRTLQTSGETVVQVVPGATSRLHRVCTADWESNQIHLICLSQPLMGDTKVRLPVEHWSWGYQAIGMLLLVLTTPSIQLHQNLLTGDMLTAKWIVDPAVRDCYLA